MSIIGRKLGNAKKHNEQILKHNRLRPIYDKVDSLFHHQLHSTHLIIIQVGASFIITS